jgi:hypothetical protein
MENVNNIGKILIFLRVLRIDNEKINFIWYNPISWIWILICIPISIIASIFVDENALDIFLSGLGKY